MSDLVVYTARRVRTMEPSLPIAEAVAVRDGHIVSVGTLESLKPWLERAPHTIDDTFANHVLMPGFIDPHLHPSMAARLLTMDFATAVEWDLPWAEIGAVSTRSDFLDVLTTLAADGPDDEPVFVYGHHPRWHGDVDRELLNGIDPNRPIVVWHRGYHSIIVNDACFQWMGLDMDAAHRHPQIDVERGAFFENGLFVANRHFLPHSLEPSRFRTGLQRARDVIHAGGHTTICDAAFPMYDLDLEWAALEEVIGGIEVPFRTEFMPYAVNTEGMMAADGSDQKSSLVEQLRSHQLRNGHRLRFGNHVKMLADGGFFAELMRLNPPGYLDGHDGEWITPPEQFEATARVLWNAGFQIHVHCTGDEGVELALSTLEKLQWERPRFDHRFTFEHFGLSDAQQVRRIGRQGALISGQVYYLYELSDVFGSSSIGYERASQMTRLGTVEREGIPFALHSDFTMAPAKPLHNAWIAANRINESGELMAPNERISLEAAMRAITIDAAFILNREAEIGSLRWGKKADFTVLQDDPWETGVEGLRDIPIWGTVFEGVPYPL
ncbi:MAG: amidohydrolase family protein [Actinomycetota bacterium]|nr:amidohydrolase family protein [Actinomycetota bacterium]